MLLLRNATLQAKAISGPVMLPSPVPTILTLNQKVQSEEDGGTPSDADVTMLIKQDPKERANIRIKKTASSTPHSSNSTAASTTENSSTRS